MDILNFKIADDADENSVRFESPDGQRYKAKEMLILSYLQIHTLLSSTLGAPNHSYISQIK